MLYVDEYHKISPRWGDRHYLVAHPRVHYALRGGSNSTGISRGNSIMRICGIYSTAGGIYPGPKKISIELEAVVLVRIIIFSKKLHTNKPGTRKVSRLVKVLVLK